MQIAMGTLIGLILASGGFCTTLVVVGVYVGSFNSKFVTQAQHSEQGKLIIIKLERLDGALDDLKIEFTKIQTIENLRKGTRES